MNKLRNFTIDLDITLLGGQSFAWSQIGDDYWGVSSDRAMKVRQDKNTNDLYWQTYPKNNDATFFNEYFQIELDHEVAATFPQDHFIQISTAKFPGLRVLKQGFEESAISYLCSPTKNIPAIRDSIRRIREKFGKRVEFDGVALYLFPKIEQLATQSKEELLECKVGFRADNILKFAQNYIADQKYKRIHELSTDDARKLLISNRGIGDKVADCILLYGLGRSEVFPLDRWGFRIAQQYYNLSEKAKYEEVRDWFSSYFGKDAGVAGQFLFEYIRSQN